jgi:hypothetical protein
LDGPTLIEAQLKKQIQDAQSAGKKKNAALPYEQLDPSNQVDLLAAVYQKNLSAEPKYPDEITAIKTKPEAAAAKVDFLTKEIKSHLTVSEADLTALAQLRATNVQQALLKDTQIAPDRVFLADNDKAKAEGGKVRLELSIR